MTTPSLPQNISPLFSCQFQPLARRASSLSLAMFTAFALLFSTGCTTPTGGVVAEQTTPQMTPTPAPTTFALKEGDVIKISFPSVPSMDVSQPVRQDGRISLPSLGDIVAAGKTTEALNKELLELYASQLASNEVHVTLVSASYTFYVSGAVLRPGKIVSDRQITALDAIMEAGGYDKAKADLRAVMIVREDNGQTKSYKVNLQQVLSGESNESFKLSPFDKVIVPEKFSWF